MEITDKTKKWILILIIQCPLLLFSQNIIIGDNHVKMKVFFLAQSDTSYIVKCEIENLTTDSLLIRDPKEFYFKGVTQSSLSMIVNNGIYTKSYYSPLNSAPLIKFSARQKLTKIDTVLLPVKTPVSINISFDYLSWKAVKRNKLKYTKIAAFPDALFFSIKDYEDYGKYIDTYYTLIFPLPEGKWEK